MWGGGVIVYCIFFGFVVFYFYMYIVFFIKKFSDNYFIIFKERIESIYSVGCFWFYLNKEIYL